MTPRQTINCECSTKDKTVKAMKDCKFHACPRCCKLKNEGKLCNQHLRKKIANEKQKMKTKVKRKRNEKSINNDPISEDSSSESDEEPKRNKVKLVTGSLRKPHPKSIKKKQTAICSHPECEEKVTCYPHRTCIVHCIQAHWKDSSKEDMCQLFSHMKAPRLTEFDLLIIKVLKGTQKMLYESQEKQNTLVKKLKGTIKELGKAKTELRNSKAEEKVLTQEVEQLKEDLETQKEESNNSTNIGEPEKRILMKLALCQNDFYKKKNIYKKEEFIKTKVQEMTELQESTRKRDASYFGEIAKSASEIQMDMDELDDYRNSVSTVDGTDLQEASREQMFEIKNWEKTYLGTFFENYTHNESVIDKEVKQLYLEQGKKGIDDHNLSAYYPEEFTSPQSPIANVVDLTSEIAPKLSESAIKADYSTLTKEEKEILAKKTIDTLTQEELDEYDSAEDEELLTGGIDDESEKSTKISEDTITKGDNDLTILEDKEESK